MRKRAKTDALALSLLGLFVMGVIACGFWNIPTLEAKKQQNTPYRSPYDAAFSPCGKHLAVADFTAAKVALIDPGSGKVAKQIPVGGGASELAWSADCKRLYVTQHEAGGVAEIDVAAGKVARTLSTAPYPVAVAVAPKSKLLLVTSMGNNCVCAIDLASRKKKKCVKVLREPRSIAVTPDESMAVVGNFLPVVPSSDPTASAALSFIDLKKLEHVCDLRLPAGGTLVRGIAISPCGCWAYVVHTVGRFNIPTTQLERGWVNTNAMSIIAMKDRKVYATVLLDHPSQGSADPWGVDLSKDGKTLWISLSGVHKLARIDVAGLHKLLKGDLSGHPRIAKPDPRNPGPQSIWHAIKKDGKNRAQLVNELAALHAADLIENIKLPGQGARGIDLSPDGKWLATALYFAGETALLNTADRKTIKTVSLGKSPEPCIVRKGERVFHDGTLCFQHWLSCATCHPDGRVDGLNWDLLNDGMGNPKNTKSMLLSDKTPPAMARGVRDSMDVASLAGFRHILFRQPEPDEVKAAREYIKSLTPTPSPRLEKDGALSAAAKRGKALFHDEKTKCATCHPDGLFTDKSMYDVGTRGELDHASVFDTPSLIELWRTAPYLHDGSAATLEDVLTTFNKEDRHGVTSHLNEKQIADLVAYLLSL